MRKILYFTLIPWLLCSCMESQVTLVDAVDLNTANQIILLLGNNQIQSNLVIEKNAQYNITVSSNEKIQALQILEQNGKPEQNFASMGTVFKKDGFISSPLEEHSRLIYALNQQISHMLTMINGVIAVDTQVSMPMPSDNLYSNADVSPSASVVIKYKQGQRIDLYTNRIKNLVSGAVPGLVPDHVYVVAMEQKN